MFNTVTVFKPVKSKEGNSEVYVLCTGYVGKDQLAPWMPVFKEQFGKFQAVLLSFIVILTVLLKTWTESKMSAFYGYCEINFRFYSLSSKREGFI